MGDHQADLDWLHRRDPETVAKDAAKAKAAEQPYEHPALPAHIEPAPPVSRPGGARPASPRPAVAGPAGHRPAGSQPASSDRVAARPARPRPRRRPLRTGLVVGFLALLLLGGYFLGVPLAAWLGVDRVDDKPSGERPDGHPGTAVLLVGSDAHGGLTPEEMTELGIAPSEDTIARTDTIMLLYKPDAGRSVLISVPRDSWVKIPGHGEGKINAAFAIGGPELVVKTLEQLTAFHIDGYAEVGFGGFARVVDALGGLDVCVDSQIPGENVYETIEPGCQRLSPKQALFFVRARHFDSQGDLGRAARQRQFLAAIMKQAAAPGVFLNPAKYQQVSQAVSKGITLGSDTGVNDTVALGLGMRNISSGKGFSMGLPVANVDGWSSDGQSMVELDEERIDALFAQLNEGDTSNLEQYAG